MYNPLSLIGKKYLITGAASGMGRETSIVLSKLGAELILVDIDEQGLNVTAEMLENKYYVLPLDLSDIKSIKPTIERVVAEFGLINGFAHIAGIPYITPLKGVKEDYNYDLECGIGEIRCADESYSGFGKDYTIDNHAAKNMEIESGIGKITVKYMNKM